VAGSSQFLLPDSRPFQRPRSHANRFARKRLQFKNNSILATNNEISILLSMNLLLVKIIIQFQIKFHFQSILMERVSYFFLAR